VEGLRRIALHARSVSVPGYPKFVAEIPEVLTDLWKVLGGTEQAWETASECDVS
jgi:hypothetical protein